MIPKQPHQVIENDLELTLLLISTQNTRVNNERTYDTNEQTNTIQLNFLTPPPM